jgi:hypothetical protein
MLAVNSYMIMVDVAQEGTGQQADPAIMEQVVSKLLQSAQAMAQQAPAQGQGMLAQMQDQEEPGDAPGPDNTPAHENAESPEYETQEGTEEDAPGETEAEDPQAGGMLARMQRRGAPA